MAESSVMDKLTSLAKRRGFIFQSSEIYGGTGSVWDYGPLGIELKRNVKERWWSTMVHQRDDVEGLDASILMNPKVWEASGHVDGFTDPLVECGKLPPALPGRSPRGRREASVPPAGPRTPSVNRASSTSCSRRSWARWRRTHP